MVLVAGDWGSSNRIYPIQNQVYEMVESPSTAEEELDKKVG